MIGAEVVASKSSGAPQRLFALLSQLHLSRSKYATQSHTYVTHLRHTAALIDVIVLSEQFSAMYVLRFAMAVRRVQAAARQFMARNRARIKSLERTWDAYEFHYISVRERVYTLYGCTCA